MKLKKLINGKEVLIHQFSQAIYVVLDLVHITFNI